MKTRHEKIREFVKAAVEEREMNGPKSQEYRRLFREACKLIKDRGISDLMIDNEVWWALFLWLRMLKWDCFHGHVLSGLFWGHTPFFHCMNDCDEFSRTLLRCLDGYQWIVSVDDKEDVLDSRYALGVNKDLDAFALLDDVR